MGIPQFQQQSQLAGTPNVNQTQSFTTVANVGYGTAAGANAPILGASYAVSGTGALNVAVGLEAAAAASILSVTLDGANYLQLNSGNTLNPGQLYTFTLPVLAGQSVNFQFVTATTIAGLRVDFVPNQ